MWEAEKVRGTVPSSVREGGRERESGLPIRGGIKVGEGRREQGVLPCGEGV